MKDMRDLMQMISESAIGEAEGNNLGDPLEGWGSTNVRMIIDLFKDIDNEEYFMRGWRKIVQNNEEQLNRWELEQMGKAFVCLVRMGPKDTYRVLRRLMLVHTDPDNQVDNPSYRPVNGPTPGLSKVG